ncbi:MAG TPA: ABC transporter ATP-binding protein [Thermoplasmata archaeon]|nr:ABC transporter ATP-binding protein [Thermoplasmata archaeon]
MDSTPRHPVVLAVRNVRKYFPIRGGLFSSHVGDVRAVDGVSLDVRESETVGLVGESGCGKTTLGRVILRLVEPTSGHTYYRPTPEVMGRLDSLYASLGDDNGSAHKPTATSSAALKELDEIAAQYSLYRRNQRKMRELRGRLQIVFQDPFSSLSPRMLVREVVGEPLEIHHTGTRRERDQRVLELLQQVGLNPEHLWRFPHEFSGGQRQRIGIARALALRPEMIVLDEPTSALDVSVQAQILNILKRLQDEQGLAYLFISHHLSVVRAMSRRVVVMYLGKVVETAPTDGLFSRPLHPYTQALLSAIPIPDPTTKRERIVLSGDVPSPAAPPPGCRFHTRCPAVMPICSKVEPEMTAMGLDHYVACHLYSSPEKAAPKGAAGALAMAEEAPRAVS